MAATCSNEHGGAQRLRRDDLKRPIMHHDDAPATVYTAVCSTVNATTYGRSPFLAVISFFPHWKRIFQTRQPTGFRHGGLSQASAPHPSDQYPLVG
jgi:hypothetical protein